LSVPPCHDPSVHIPDRAGDPAGLR
jgi:hypothetical protein